MIIYFIILSAVVSRFIPHMPNFAPITALAIFAGANLGWKKSVGLTLAVRFISDIFLGFFSWPLMLSVYAGHLSGVLFGVWIKRSGGYRWVKIIGSSLGSSAIFFIVTNFAFLYADYPHTVSGIAAAYINGLPFLRGTIFGDLFYAAGLFLAYQATLYILRAYKRKKDLRFSAAPAI